MKLFSNVKMNLKNFKYKKTQGDTEYAKFCEDYGAPIRIYNCLQLRRMSKPIFLSRTLSYMTERSKRTNKSRCSFMVDDMLSKKMDETRMAEYLTIIFLEFFNGTVPKEVEVTTTVTICSEGNEELPERRKEFVCPAMKINDSEFPNGEKMSAVCIPTNIFTTLNESVHLSYMLQFSVTMPGIRKSEMMTMESEPLTVFENSCLLSAGNYDISMHGKFRKAKKVSKILKTIPDTFMNSLKLKNNLTDWENCPKLKVHIAWTNEKCSSSSVSFKPNESNEEVTTKNNEKSRIIYQFNGNSRLQIERDQFRCFLCELDCMRLYSLLQHLELCHTRFNFEYLSSTSIICIDITINGLYDESPHDEKAMQISFFRPKGSQRSQPNLSQYLKVNKLKSENQFSIGRLFYHSTTRLPIYPDDDTYSEDEADWSDLCGNNMIDGHVDMDEREKEMMKLWNRHVTQYRHVYQGRINLPLSVAKFIEINGAELLQMNLYSSFILHLGTLFDNDLISIDDHFRLVHKLQMIDVEKQEIDGSIGIVGQSRIEQLNEDIDDGKLNEMDAKDRIMEHQLVQCMEICASETDDAVLMNEDIVGQNRIEQLNEQKMAKHGEMEMVDGKLNKMDAKDIRVERIMEEDQLAQSMEICDSETDFNDYDEPMQSVEHEIRDHIDLQQCIEM